MFWIRLGKGLACGLVVAISSTVAAQQTQEKTSRLERNDQPLTEARRASELTDADVIGAGNEKIGDVDDWIMDREGKPLFLIVGEGGVLGIGQDLVAVPASAARIGYNQDRGWTVAVDMTEEQLESAPKIGDDFRRLIDPEWYRTNATYFGLGKDGKLIEDVPSTMIRLGQLVGADVENAAQEKIADVSDVILDQNYRPAYAILGAGGFLGIGEDKIPVPYKSLRIGYDENRQRNTVTVHMTKDQLERAPRIENDDYRVLLNAETQRRIDQYYAGPATGNP